MSTETTRPVTAARGTTKRCRSWRAEALLRMLENVLEVGERPEDLVVYASLGKAARDWPSYHAIVRALTELGEDETLVLQSGRPVGVLPTHGAAPMVVSAVNNTVGNWATEETFYRRMHEGRTIWGGLTAAAWQYIGRQGVLQGTYELLRTVLLRHFGGTETARSRWLLTAGMGGMGSAQSISARMLGLSSLVVEADPAKIRALHGDGGLDHIAGDPDEALRVVRTAADSGTPTAVGLCGNAATVFAEIAEHPETRPDIVTDQTAAHDARYGYLPEGMDLAEWHALRESDPAEVESRARQGMAKQVLAMLAMSGHGAVVFENGNNLRVQASAVLGTEQAFAIPGFMEAYLRPLFCRGIGPFRWVALSGDPADLAIVDELAATLFPERPEVAGWIRLAREHVPVQGLPARSCWLGHGERSRLAVAVNDEVRTGRISAPVLFSRDHLDSAGMTHPRIGTEGMRDGSDGVTDWPLLDSMLLSAGGADLVAVHSGGGGYAGWMQSAGVSVVADGTGTAEPRLRLALDLDTGLGVLRHAVAGYPEAADAVTASNAPRAAGPALRWIDVQEGALDARTDR